MSHAVPATSSLKASKKENLPSFKQNAVGSHLSFPTSNTALAEFVQNRLAENEHSSEIAPRACSSAREPRRANSAPPEFQAAQDLNKARQDLKSEACQFVDIKHDQERVDTYIEARQVCANISMGEAREASKYGMLYLEMTAEERVQTQALLDRYGIARSPLCWPRSRLELAIDLDQCPVLGKGKSHTVYGLRWNGVDYAFKPSRKLSAENAKSWSLSGTGELQGLDKTRLYPELRCMAAVQVADALGLLGEHGILPMMEMSIVNGMPGILSQRVKGAPEAKTMLWSASVRNDTPLGQTLLKEVNERCRTLDSVGPEMRKLGFSNVELFSDGMMLTGAWGKRNPRAKNRYTSSSWNLDANNAQVFIKLINMADAHPGNFVYRYVPETKSWKLALVDPDEGFAPINPKDCKLQNRHQQSVFAGTCPWPVVISTKVHNALRSTRCREMIDTLCPELAPFFSKQEIATFQANFKALRQANLPAFSPATDSWKVGADLRPDALLAHKIVGYSTNSQWDSDDSEDEVLSLPEATEV